MKVKIEVEFIPFTVPNFVMVKESPQPRENGFQEGRKFHVSELDQDTLWKLCEQFKDDVFKKANAQLPPMEVTNDR